MPEVMQALNAGDVESAIQQVGCQVANKDNIVDAVLHNIKEDLEHKKFILSEKQNSLISLNSTINVYKDEVNNLKNMIEIIPQLIDKNDIEFIKNNNEFDKEILNEYEIIDVDTKIKFYGI
jgi:hypothetical protein